VVSEIGHNGIVNDATILVEDHRKGGLSGLKLSEVSGVKSFQKLESVISVKSKHKANLLLELAHMGNIKNSSVVSTSFVLLDNTKPFVKRRHGPTSELDHFRSVQD
jgi:hypothetical protein